MIKKRYVQMKLPIITTCSRNLHSMTQTRMNEISKDERQEMMAIWPDVVKDLAGIEQLKDIPNMTKWIAKSLNYNVPGGKKHRGCALIDTYKQLVPSDQLTEENLRLARIIGWCVEMIQAHFLVLDDIFDHAETRRGQPCWYRQNDVGLAAISDGVLLEQAAYELLRRHFRSKPCYLDLVHTLQRNTYRTTIGQILDTMTSNFGNKADLNLYTIDRYNSISEYKTSYYTFVMPVRLSMYFAGIKDPDLHKQAETLLIKVGHFFQVQDDYLDCFGDPKVTGKVGTDIQEGKCSWLVVQALKRVTLEQRNILEECYGVNDLEKVAKVKQLYSDLELKKEFLHYQEEMYNHLKTQIEQISQDLPHDIFLNIVKKVYRRKS